MLNGSAWSHCATLTNVGCTANMDKLLIMYNSMLSGSSF